MNRLIWLVVMLPVSLFFTGFGIYAWKRKKPMWFWSGTGVRESEITDVAAYNKANGIMWIAFSGILWLSTILGFLRMRAGGICLIAGCAVGIPVLPMVYGKIFEKYKREKHKDPG